jgi:ADP-ribosyl-[dinitrogen reductase] hydrolase
LLDKELNKQRRALQKLIRATDRGEVPPDLSATLQEIEQGLHSLVRTKMDDLPYRSEAATVPTRASTDGSLIKIPKRRIADDFGFRNRARGAIIGLAVGSALGITLDGRSRDSFRPITSMMGGGPDALRAGQWTEQIGQALVLAESLVTQQSFDPSDIQERFQSWCERGLPQFEAPELLVSDEYLGLFSDQNRPFLASKTDIENLQVIMRIAPIIICYCKEPIRFNEIIERQSYFGEATLFNQAPCHTFIRIFFDALTRGKNDYMTASFDRGDSQTERSLDAKMKEYKFKSRDQIDSSNSLSAIVEATLWSVTSTDNFENALTRAVNLGNASASIGALTGQLAGAMYGELMIPTEWKEDLVGYNAIKNMADKCVDFCLK